MNRIKKYSDFNSDRGKAQPKPKEKEAPHQKSDDDNKPHKKSDKTPHKEPVGSVTIPGWETY